MNMKKGITLIALMLSVVIVIIIVAVTFNFGNNNVITDANNSINKQNHLILINDVNEEIRIIKIKNQIYDEYFISDLQIQQILNNNGVYNVNTLVLTGDENTKISLFDIDYADVKEYFRINVGNSSFTIETTLIDSYYVIKYSLNNGSTWNVYTGETSIEPGTMPKVKIFNMYDELLGEL